MKKLLLGSIVLLFFSLSVVVIQTSCSKTTAQSPNAVNQLNKLVYMKNWGASPQIWICNYDGSNAAQVPVVLPANVTFDINVSTRSLKVSPDGQTVFFAAIDNSLGTINTQVYSCSINGGNATLVIPQSGSDYAILCQAY